MNPICVLLPAQIEAGIKILEKAVAFQTTIKKTVDTIIAVTDLSSLIDSIPEPGFSFSANPSELNAILNSCPGQFPNIPAINASFSLGIKGYLDFLKGSPLGILKAYLDPLNAIMAPLPDLIETLKNYLTCMQNLCGLLEADFNETMGRILQVESNLNLGPGGTPQILDSATAAIMNDYNNRVDSIKSQLSSFS